ncbi:MAG: transposase [Pseudomonadota bacterium]
MQRVEIITAKEPRRRWSDEEKRRLVAEAFAPGAIASHVARQNRVAESCLFAWRKRFSAPPNGSRPDEPPRLIPIMVDGTSAPVTPPMIEATSMPPSRHAVITWPDGLRLEVPAGYPQQPLKALIGVLRQAR